MGIPVFVESAPLPGGDSMEHLMDLIRNIWPQMQASDRNPRAVSPHLPLDGTLWCSPRVHGCAGAVRPEAVPSDRGSSDRREPPPDPGRDVVRDLLLELRGASTVLARGLAVHARAPAGLCCA